MIGLLAFRYAFSKTARHRASSIRIIIATTLSLAMVVVVLSVMDYMQTSRFNEIRRVRSFDIVVSGRHKDEIEKLYPDAIVFEYGEGEALISSSAFLVRYVDSFYDGGVRMLAGNMDSLAIPYTLYRQNECDSFIVSLMRKGKSGVVLPRSERIGISGIYATSMGYEFDSTTVFLPLSFSDDSTVFKTAIKGIDIKEKEKLESLGYDATTWKEAESGLYSAFLIEKAMMYVVLALMFVIIGVSIKQSVRIFYREKRKERAELEILGLDKRVVDMSFLFSFLIVFLLSLILSYVLCLFLLPAVEKAGQVFIALNMLLEFPYGVFFSFSSILFLFTLLFALNESRKDRLVSLLEVVNAR